MRIFTLIALLALSGCAALTGVTTEPADPQETGHSMTDKRHKEITAKKDADIVRTRSGSPSFNVSEIMGRS